MTSQQIKYFASVARLMSFTKAAQECYVSQTAISRQIKTLEEELEFPLFLRDTSSVSLTPGGEYFYQHCQKMIEQMNAAVKEARRRSTGDGMPLNIGVSSAIEQHLILDHLTHFHMLYPDIRMLVQQAQGSQLLTCLDEGQTDVLFTNASEVERLQNGIQLEIARPHNMLMMSANHPLKERTSVSPLELEGLSVIVIGDHSEFEPSPAVKKQLRLLGFGGWKTIATSNINSMTLMVAAGMGIAIVSSSFQLGAPSHVVFAEIEGVRHEDTVVATRLKEHFNPAAALFFDALHNALNPPEISLNTNLSRSC